MKKKEMKMAYTIHAWNRVELALKKPQKISHKMCNFFRSLKKSIYDLSPQKLAGNGKNQLPKNSQYESFIEQSTLFSDLRGCTYSCVKKVFCGAFGKR